MLTLLATVAVSAVGSAVVVQLFERLGLGGNDSFADRFSAFLLFAVALAMGGIVWLKY